jgi:hypothetical protein
VLLPDDRDEPVVARDIVDSFGNLGPFRVVCAPVPHGVS